MIRYRVELAPDDNDTLLVTSPDIPIVTYGDDRASALRHAVDAAEVVIASMMDHREDVPVPDHAPDAAGDFVRLPLQTELKLRLYLAMRTEKLTRADLRRRLGWPRESVDRLFRIDHNSRIAQIDEAFAALGKQVSMEVGDAG
jgi:antitoxin HicB